MDLIPVLYDAVYRDKMLGRDRLRLVRFNELEAAEEDSECVRAWFRDLCTGEVQSRRTDALILATGYDHSSRIPLLNEVDPWLISDGSEYAMNRNYSVRSLEGFGPNIYLLGYSEHSHGFSETLLSLMPLRAEEILADVVAQHVQPVCA